MSIRKYSILAIRNFKPDLFSLFLPISALILYFVLIKEGTDFFSKKQTKYMIGLAFLFLIYLMLIALVYVLIICFSIFIDVLRFIPKNKLSRKQNLLVFASLLITSLIWMDWVTFFYSLFVEQPKTIFSLLGKMESAPKSLCVSR